MSFRQARLEKASAEVLGAFGMDLSVTHIAGGVIMYRTPSPDELPMNTAIVAASEFNVFCWTASSTFDLMAQVLNARWASRKIHSTSVRDLLKQPSSGIADLPGDARAFLDGLVSDPAYILISDAANVTKHQSVLGFGPSFTLGLSSSNQAEIARSELWLAAFKQKGRQYDEMPLPDFISLATTFIHNKVLRLRDLVS